MMGSRLLWALCVGFLVGVFVRSFYPLGVAYACLALLLACAALLFALLDGRKMNSLIVVAVALVAGAIGIMRMDQDVLLGDQNLTEHINQKVTIIGSIVAEPDVRDNGVRLSVQARALSIGTATVAVHAGVLVEAPPHAVAGYGDEVRASGTLGLPQAFDTGDGRLFDYPDYLGMSSIGYTLSFARVQSIGKNSGNIVQAFVIKVKDSYLNGLDAVLPEPESGLGGGITVGDKRSIGPELSADFQKVGLIQMVVLSGYNITVVVNFFAAMFSRAPRKFQFALGVLVVIFFILVSGGASSAVRAGIMALIALAARHAGRTYESLRALALAACVMVLWNPFTLAFDPGFQLSALAMLGLALGTPIIDRQVQWIPNRFALREIVSSSLATQIAVLPLLLYQSGTLSIVALPANILAMIPVPMAMLASLAAAVGGMLFGASATVLAFPAHVLLSYIITVARLLSSLPFSSLSIGAFAPEWLAVSYAVLGVGLWYMQKSYQLDLPTNTRRMTTSQQELHR
jgi:competence protein ComEC